MTVELGTHYQYKRSGTRRSLVERKDTFQYVPLLQNLEWLLQNGDVCKEVSMHAEYGGGGGTPPGPYQVIMVKVKSDLWHSVIIQPHPHPFIMQCYSFYCLANNYFACRCLNQPPLILSIMVFFSISKMAPYTKIIHCSVLMIMPYNLLFIMMMLNQPIRWGLIVVITSWVKLVYSTL